MMGHGGFSGREEAADRRDAIRLGDMCGAPLPKAHCDALRPFDGRAPSGWGQGMSFALEAGSFRNGGEIPKRYTASGQDVSPELSWRDAPDGTRSLALIVEDPGAPQGTFTHWVLWKIPAGERGLPEGQPRRSVLANGAQQGINDFNRIGYTGPCPPQGKLHHYVFRLYALDVEADPGMGATRSRLEQVMSGHVLAQAEWVGTFLR